jgi:hypothetical protein
VIAHPVEGIRDCVFADGLRRLGSARKEQGTAAGVLLQLAQHVERLPRGFSEEKRGGVRRLAVAAGCYCGARDRTRTGMPGSLARHFKCLVSTCFTTRAGVKFQGQGCENTGFVRSRRAEMLRPLYVGVRAWQFGQSSRRLPRVLFSRLPSM